MAVEYYIGNTDHEWFDFCAEQMPLPQVNFWQPSLKRFHVLEDGGIFFFRRKSPINKIGGFGRLAFSGDASIADCWDSFGVSNGVESKKRFVQLISKYKRSVDVTEHTHIGIKVIVDPVFLKQSDWFDLPEDWSPNIVSGKGYGADTDHGRALYRKYVELKTERPYNGFAGFSSGEQEPFRFGAPQKIRLGQNQFRLAVLSAYDGKCAVTGECVHEALDAAHIVPFSASHDNSINNGLLLRKDIHALYDKGLIDFDANGIVHVSDSLKNNYNDSSDFLSIDGKKIRFPRKKEHWPFFDRRRTKTDT